MAEETPGTHDGEHLVEHLDAQRVPGRTARRASLVLRETSAALNDLKQEPIRSEALLQSYSSASRQQDYSPAPEEITKPEARRRSVMMHPRPPKLEMATSSVRQSAVCVSPNVVSVKGLQATPASSPGVSARFGSKRASLTALNDVQSFLESCQGPAISLCSPASFTVPQRSAPPFSVPQRFSLSFQVQLDSPSRHSLQANASNVLTPAPPAGSAAASARMRWPSAALPVAATDSGPVDQRGSRGSSTAAEPCLALPDGLLQGASLGKPIPRSQVVCSKMAEIWMPDETPLVEVTQFTDEEGNKAADGMASEDIDAGVGFVTLKMKKAAKQFSSFMNKLLLSPTKQRRPESQSSQGTAPERAPVPAGSPRPPSGAGPPGLGPPPVLRGKSHRATWDCGFEAPLGMLGDHTMSGALTSMGLGMPMPRAGKADGVPARHHVMSLSAHNLGVTSPRGRTQANNIKHAGAEPRV